MRGENEVIEYHDGAERESLDGKGRLDLIPFALVCLAKLYEEGAKNYALRDWGKDIPSSHCVNSCIRHIMKYIRRMRDDRDDQVQIYVSGALTGRKVVEVKRERTWVKMLLTQAGFQPVDPFLRHFPDGIPTTLLDCSVDGEFVKRLGLSEKQIVEQDKKLLQDCDAVLIITGDTITSGTWLEFGYARYRLGIPVVVVSQNPSTWTTAEATHVAGNVDEAISWLREFFGRR